MKYLNIVSLAWEFSLLHIQNLCENSLSNTQTHACTPVHAHRHAMNLSCHKKLHNWNAVKILWFRSTQYFCVMFSLLCSFTRGLYTPINIWMPQTVSLKWCTGMGSVPRDGFLITFKDFSMSCVHVCVASTFISRLTHVTHFPPICLPVHLSGQPAIALQCDRLLKQVKHVIL